MQDPTTTCGHCKGLARVPYPDEVPVCGCGRPGNHPVLCAYRRSFFEGERQARPEERAYALARLSGKSKKESAELVGSTSNALETEATRKFMAQILDDAGLTDEVLAEKIKSGLDAKMSLKLRDETGKEELKEVEDNTNQFRYAELAVKIKGGMAEKGQFQFGDGNVVYINQFSRNVPPDNQEEIVDVTPESSG